MRELGFTHYASWDVVQTTAGSLFVSDLPTGVVTFLFTDIEGSTRLWDQYPYAMPARMAIHTSAVDLRDDGYFGPPLNRVARMLAAAYGGQTLICHATQEQ